MLNLYNAFIVFDFLNAVRPTSTTKNNEVNNSITNKISGHTSVRDVDERI